MVQQELLPDHVKLLGKAHYLLRAVTRALMSSSRRLPSTELARHSRRARHIVGGGVARAILCRLVTADVFSNFGELPEPSSAPLLLFPGRGDLSSRFLVELDELSETYAKRVAVKTQQSPLHCSLHGLGSTCRPERVRLVG